MIPSILIILTILFPAFAMIYYLLKLDHELLTILTAILCLCLGSVLTLHFPLHIPKVTDYLGIYLFFAGLYILVFSNKIGIRLTHRLIPVAALTLFIVADFWEIPIFIYGLIGYGSYHKWLGSWPDHIHRIYVIFSVIVLLKIQKFQVKKRCWGFPVLALISSFLILYYYYLIPWGLAGFFVRILSFLLLGIFTHKSIVKGVDHRSPNDTDKT